MAWKLSTKQIRRVQRLRLHIKVSWLIFFFWFVAWQVNQYSISCTILSRANEIKLEIALKLIRFRNEWVILAENCYFIHSRPHLFRSPLNNLAYQYLLKSIDSARLIAFYMISNHFDIQKMWFVCQTKFIPLVAGLKLLVTFMMEVTTSILWPWLEYDFMIPISFEEFDSFILFFFFFGHY